MPWLSLARLAAIGKGGPPGSCGNPCGNLEHRLLTAGSDPLEFQGDQTPTDIEKCPDSDFETVRFGHSRIPPRRCPAGRARSPAYSAAEASASYRFPIGGSDERASRCRVSDKRRRNLIQLAACSEYSAHGSRIARGGGPATDGPHGPGHTASNDNATTSGGFTWQRSLDGAF